MWYPVVVSTSWAVIRTPLPAGPSADAEEHQDGDRPDDPGDEPSAGTPCPARQTGGGAGLEAEPIYAHRSGDVLDRVLADEVIAERKLALHLIVGRTGKADPTALGQALQASRDVDAVPVEPRPLDDHVAQIDPHAELHPAGDGPRGVAGPELALDLDRALDRVHHARELRQDVVAGGIHHAPAIPGHGRGDRLAVLRDRANGGHLVVAHEAAVAFHVGAQDGGELAFHRGSAHGPEFYPHHGHPGAHMVAVRWPRASG